MSRRSSPANAAGCSLPSLLLPTLGIAFTDVLADALMIEVGKPRGLTGRFQSVQWFAAYFALLPSGAVGGWLTSQRPARNRVSALRAAMDGQPRAHARLRARAA